MSETASRPSHLRPRREKVFGPARGVALDRNAKARIMVYAKAWSAKPRQPGQHRGPLTRATMEILQALLWGFHNSKSGLCFPSYEAIAAKAECCRDTAGTNQPAFRIAVGTPITGRTPHRTVRAAFPHAASTLGV